MLLRSKPTLAQRIVDYLMPDNCRKRLHLAAQVNTHICNDTICMLRQYRTEIKDGLKNKEAA